MENLKKAEAKKVATMKIVSTMKIVKKTKKDRKLVSFNGVKYGKGRVVLAIVTQYVKDHPGLTYANLKEVFPDSLHSLGIVKPLYKAKKMSVDHKRFFTDAVLKLQDKAVAVCADFGKSNIGKFLKHASHIGYNAKMVAA